MSGGLEPDLETPAPFCVRVRWALRVSIGRAAANIPIPIAESASRRVGLCMRVTLSQAAAGIDSPVAESHRGRAVAML